MFTGLVAAMGAVLAREVRGPAARVSLRARFEGEPLQLGESIAVDGCCLSVMRLQPHLAPGAEGFEVDVSAETLARTTLGRLSPGSVVNLERSLRAGDRLGGHLVSGHVDGVGTVAELRPAGEMTAMAFVLPAELARFVAKKGSIAVNGVSLTVNAVGADRFEVMLIPITLAQTNLSRLAPGDPVNLEIDLVARYLARLLEGGAEPTPARSS